MAQYGEIVVWHLQILIRIRMEHSLFGPLISIRFWTLSQVVDLNRPAWATPVIIKDSVPACS